MASRLAVLGLGKMGSAVAARLLARGHEVWGFDPAETIRASAEAAGVRGTADPMLAVEGAAAVYTSLPSDTVLLASLGHDAPLWSAFTDDAVLVELSTVSPAAIREVAAAAPSTVTVFDAPVSGGPKEAMEGTLSIFLGSLRDPAPAQRAFLDEIAMHVVRMGGIGAGKTMKIVNNAISMTNVIIAAEAIALGERNGIALPDLYARLIESGADSRQLRSRFPRAIAGDFMPGAAIRIIHKDIDLALRLAEDSHAPAPMLSLASSIYAAAESAGLADLDPVALLQLYAGATADGGAAISTLRGN